MFGAPREGQILFSVCDNGMGIHPKYHLQIFEPFRRLHGSDFPGTGLGLAICQRVIERYEGRIWVESAPGHAQHFCSRCHLPVSRAERDAAAFG
jgi:signal transduction histidine kinase